MVNLARPWSTQTFGQTLFLAVLWGSFWIRVTFDSLDRVKLTDLSMWVGCIHATEGLTGINGRGRRNAFPLPVFEPGHQFSPALGLHATWLPWFSALWTQTETHRWLSWVSSLQVVGFSGATTAGASGFHVLTTVRLPLPHPACVPDSSVS